MKIIILGAGGFLGSALAVAAKSEGVSVVGVGRCESPPFEGVFDEWIAADVARLAVNPIDWRDHMGAAVFHLAADTRIYELAVDIIETSKQMARVAVNLTRAVGGRLMFFSSSAVYSDRRTNYPVSLITEADATEPSTDYGQAKWEAEKVITETCAEATVLRIFSVVGPGLLAAPDRGHLVQAVARAVCEGSEIVLRVDAAGRPAMRDYVLADDVCRVALEWARGEKTEKLRGVFNFCSGVAISSEAVVAAAECAVAHSIPVRLQFAETNQNPVMVGSPEKLARIIGWHPRAAMETFWTDWALGQRDDALKLSR
ncbi:NAD-dependent epimerase/dehydratase family protein [Oleiharenicola lentus]|uniref:NAD-dependent epimerase/dehydratase family protein n=1 Tax=Oleiharenicola lentus TaxID=2508720 RepID=UPI003F662431